MHPLADMIAGEALLGLGWRLLWLFVAIAGFYVGGEFTRALLAES